MDNLEETEKQLFRIFFRLISKVRIESRVVYGRKKSGLGQFCFFKDQDKWISYIDGCDEINNYREYDNLYDLCIEFFKMIDKDKGDYCLKRIPPKSNFYEDDAIISVVDRDSKEMFAFMSNYLQMKINSMDVENMKWDVVRMGPGSIPKTKKYDKLKLMEFLSLYKIDRLVALNKISANMGQELKDLMALRSDLNIRIKSLIDIDREENKELVFTLCDKKAEIDKILAKYNLLHARIDLEKIIDSLIKTEDYLSLREDLANYSEYIYGYDELIKDDMDDEKVSRR